MPKNYELRRARSGQKLLPPNPLQWENEHNGLDIRQEMRLSLDVWLDHKAIFDLLEDVHLLPHGQLEITHEVAEQFRNLNSSRWSGMCVPCPDGPTIVLYNDSHPETRVRATLLEEFFHLWLGHPPTRLRLLANGTASRDFHAIKESEAYGSGAAALVPYKALREMLVSGLDVRDIAKHFRVSSQLVTFRARVTKLGRFLRAWN